jgi:hypothetical protein
LDLDILITDGVMDMVVTGVILVMHGVIPDIGDLVMDMDGDIPDIGEEVIMDIIITLIATEEEVLPHIMEEEIMLLTEVMQQTETILTEISQIEVIQTEAIPIEIAITQIEEASILTLEEVLL